ncbi:hypothetical protein WJX72_001682 [[Myrmecia] bisecta]|uniref:Uncharacterized protein n=1 Tax=[Myrmecia] bisecta TaxID=41462 RepID=A0AAW1Q628_9CHLO
MTLHNGAQQLPILQRALQLLHSLSTLPPPVQQTAIAADCTGGRRRRRRRNKRRGHTACHILWCWSWDR